MKGECVNIRVFFRRLALCALSLTALLSDAVAYTNDQIFQNGSVIALKSNGPSVGNYVRFAGGVDGAWGDVGGTTATDTACQLGIENAVKNSDGSYSCRLRSSTGYLFQGMLSIVRIRSTAVNTNQDTQVDFIPAGTDASTGNQLFYIRTYFDKTSTDPWLGASSNKSIADTIAGGSTYAFWDVEAAAFLNDRGGGTLRNHDNQTRSPGKWSNAAFVPDSNGNMVNHGATLWFVDVVSISPAVAQAAADKAAADKLAADAAAQAAAKAAADQAAADKAAADKLAADAAAKATADKALADKLAADQAAADAAAKAAADKAAADKLVADAAAKAAADKALADKLAADKLAAEKAAKALEEAKKTQVLKGSGEKKVAPAGGSGKGVLKELSQVKQVMPSAPVKQQKVPAKRR